MTTKFHRLLPLILFFLVSSASADSNFTSIDCGASSSYMDGNGIEWETDESYVSNGENHVVENPDSVSETMRTLRVFSSRKKNCYPIPVAGGGRVLVRASFFYGNYDKKAAPPTFALQFDANSWATVVTSAEEPVHFEAVYDVFAEGTAVCVAQMEPGQLPFVSAIAVRTLEAGMYDDVDYTTSALFLRARLAFAAPAVVRYPSDDYDRIWMPVVASNGLIAIKSDTTVMDPTTVEDKPPADVLLNAITTDNVTSDIILPLAMLPTATSVPAYVNLYFAEMTQLGPSDNRIFQIYVGSELVAAAISPRYQSAVEYLVTVAAATANTTIILIATKEATLPPIVSAIEVLVARDGLSNGTDASDVEGLIALQDKFTVLDDWSGDPCLPATFNVDWVGCNSDSTSPRVIALYLSGYGLSGDLPDLSTMTALQTIDLSNNSITGQVPDFFGKLPQLKELNLANNKLSGTIPSSISKNNNIKLTVCGNPDLSSSDGHKACDGSGSTSNTPNLPRGKMFSSSATLTIKDSSNLLLPALFSLVWFDVTLQTILIKHVNRCLLDWSC